MDRVKGRKFTTSKYRQKERKLKTEGEGIFKGCELIKVRIDWNGGKRCPRTLKTVEGLLRSVAV
jgi:hypothetical protein